MTILDEIIAYKKKEIEEKKSLFPVKLLEKSIHFEPEIVSLKKYLQRPDKCGIIAEYKRRSPSKGVINNYASVEMTSIGYMQAGAAALSILTENKFFGGSNDDLTVARRFNFCPILRKDFIIDEYQVVEAKSIGADVILLIAAVLEPEKLKSLAAFARSLGLEVLMEVHNKDELQKNLHEEVDLVGVNNRDLKSFEVTTETSRKLAPLIPDKYIKVSESGISEPGHIHELRDHGFQGFLIGEYFMKHSRPGNACAEFISLIKSKTETFNNKR